MLGVRLSKKLEDRLTILSQKTHRPKSYYVKQALETYLDLHESELLAIAHYEEQVRNGTLKTKSMNEILKELNFDRSELVD